MAPRRGSTLRGTSASSTPSSPLNPGTAYDDSGHHPLPGTTRPRYSPYTPSSITSTPPSTPPVAERPLDGSALENRAFTQYMSTHNPRALSLSVYELPTASFFWPRAAARLDTPLLLMNPRQSESQRARSEHSSVDGSPTMSARDWSPWSAISQETACSTPESTPCLEIHERVSALRLGECPASPSDRFLKHNRTARPSSVDVVNTSLEQVAMANHVAYRAPHSAEMMAPQRCPHPLGVASDKRSADRRDAGAAHRAARSSESDVGGTPSASARKGDDTGSAEEEEEEEPYPIPKPNLEPDAWQQWARPKSPPIRKGRDWQCVWVRKDRHGVGIRCTYEAKRHLIKRHIQSYHMKLRFWICSKCGSETAQRSAMKTHINTHTGKKPHHCKYPDCWVVFGDPARRVRHMQRDHGYITNMPRGWQPAGQGAGGLAAQPSRDSYGSKGGQ
ncbi:hypothetical protein C2E23DRAFT_822051 [Lenzites betulinus]|nr:hypothetical protein C2E23DRAFT_822051 [Lenzites betulinus]